MHDVVVQNRLNVSHPPFFLIRVMFTYIHRMFAMKPDDTIRVLYISWLLLLVKFIQAEWSTKVSKLDPHWFR